jgi:NitT/TauT family transport system substrate-binding protein
MAAGMYATIAPASAEEIVVTSWGTNLNSVPYAVAMEKGFFKDAGVDVSSILSTSGGGTAVRNVLASATPYGEVALEAAIAAVKQGLPVVIVNAACRTVSEAAWVTKPDSSIKTIQDLAGKKVAFTRPKSVSEMLLIQSLGASNIKIDSVERVAAGGYREGLTLLDNGGVDVAPVIEPMRSTVQDRYREVFSAISLLKPMITTVGITTREFAQKEPKKLAAIIEGRRKAVEYVYAHPDEAAELMAKRSEMKADVLKASIQHVIGSKFWVAGELEPVELNNLVDGLKVIGQIEGDVKWSELVDQSFLAADQRRGL